VGGILRYAQDFAQTASKQLKLSPPARKVVAGINTKAVQRSQDGFFFGKLPPRINADHADEAGVREKIPRMIGRFKGRKLKPDEEDVIGNVEKYGWTVMHIKDEPGKPGWSFTIGLFENFRHPEVIIFGMKQDRRHSILNWIGENAKNGNSFTPEKEHDWVLEGYKCWSRPVEKKWYRDLLGYARWFYAQEEFPCVQAIWPDKEGRYPWEPQYPYSDQPLLYESDLLSARMMHWASDHKLSNEEWPFAVDPHTKAFVSRCVVEEGSPIMRVYHEANGDWQFIGPVDDPEQDGCEISCFHCVVERDPTIKLLAGLPTGYCAGRYSVSDSWEWDQIKPEGISHAGEK
jgi:hypothetical protein